MTLESNINCAFCKTKATTQLADYDNLFFCGNCGTAFLESIPNDRDLEDFYNNQYWQPTPPPPKDLRYHHTDCFLDLINEYNPSAQTICDVGCGYGVLLNSLSKEGFDVTGIEYSKNNVKYINEELGLKAISGSIRNLNLNFDVITLCHMIEHSNNPFDDLKHAMNHLNKNGLLIITVPNFNSLASKFLKTKWEWYSYPNHLFYFTLESFKYFAKENNLELVFSTSKTRGSKLLAEFVEDYIEQFSDILEPGIIEDFYKKKLMLENLRNGNFYEAIETLGLAEEIMVVFKAKK